jgi:hypothetical protein
MTEHDRILVDKPVTDDAEESGAVGLETDCLAQAESQVLGFTLYCLKRGDFFRIN